MSQRRIQQILDILEDAGLIDATVDDLGEVRYAIAEAGEQALADADAVSHCFAG